MLQLLPTHLSFREMAGGLHVSANTVKTHAHAVYRKLDACSRSEAVVRAREAGLLGDAPDELLRPAHARGLNCTSDGHLLHASLPLLVLGRVFRVVAREQLVFLALAREEEDDERRAEQRWR